MVYPYPPRACAAPHTTNEVCWNIDLKRLFLFDSQFQVKLATAAHRPALLQLTSSTGTGLSLEKVSSATSMCLWDLFQLFLTLHGKEREMKHSFPMFLRESIFFPLEMVMPSALPSILFYPSNYNSNNNKIQKELHTCCRNSVQSCLNDTQCKSQHKHLLGRCWGKTQAFGLGTCCNRRAGS